MANHFRGEFSRLAGGLPDANFIACVPIPESLLSLSAWHVSRDAGTPSRLPAFADVRQMKGPNVCFGHLVCGFPGRSGFRADSFRNASNADDSFDGRFSRFPATLKSFPAFRKPPQTRFVRSVQAARRESSEEVERLLRLPGEATHLHGRLAGKGKEPRSRTALGGGRHLPALPR